MDYGAGRPAHGVMFCCVVLSAAKRGQEAELSADAFQTQCMHLQLGTRWDTAVKCAAPGNKIIVDLLGSATADLRVYTIMMIICHERVDFLHQNWLRVTQCVVLSCLIVICVG
jgi:hypothetical protein